jgi:hypothetical protein
MAEGNEDGGAGGNAEELENALANADDDDGAEELEEDRRAAALAKMAHVPESKEEVEIVSRAQ